MKYLLNANTETASLVILLALMAYMHKMLIACNNNISVLLIKNMFYSITMFVVNNLHI